MKKSILTAILFSVLAASVASAEQVYIQIIPGDFGQPSANYPGRYLTSAVSGQYTGELSPQIEVGTWYTIYVQPCTVGRYRAVNNGDDTYTVETEGGLIGSQNTDMSNLTVSFDNISVTIDAGDYNGGWQANWICNRTSGNQTVRVPKNTYQGGYQIFWGHSGQGNRVLFSVDEFSTVTVDSCTENIVFIGLTNMLIFPNSQEVTVQVPAGLAELGLNWWQIDGGGNFKGQKVDGEFVDTTGLLIAGNYNFCGDAGFPQFSIHVPADATGWTDSTVQTWTAGDYTWSFSGPSAQTWEIEGDANLDCKVNIIDLIFVRNRLNQPVDSEDNWQADCNSDGKINIIDLIYVRNRLNSKCE